MSGLHLPGDVAQQIKSRNVLTGLRLQVATEIYAPLVCQQFMHAMAEKNREQDPFETGEPISESTDRLEIELNFALPATVAIQAADTLLHCLGVIAPAAEAAPSNPSQ